MSKPNPKQIMEDAIWSALDGNVKHSREDATIIIAFDMDAIVDHVLDELAEAATITTIEQLEALPIGSVVHTGENLPDSYHEGAWTKNDDGWYWWGMDFAEPASSIGLPALLLYHPDERHS